MAALRLSAGATSNYFGHPDWQKLAPGMKSLDDGIAVRRMVLTAFEVAEREPDIEKSKALLTFVLVGGGPTGVELDGSIAELAHQALTGDFRHISPAKARIVFKESLRHEHRNKSRATSYHNQPGAHIYGYRPAWFH